MYVLFLVISLYISSIFCDLTGNKGSRCPAYYFRCLDGECIPSTSVCDGAIDCRDRSDERLAVCVEYASLCPPYAFRCGYGACVDKITICNGIQDCADNSDELLPQCLQSNSTIKKCKLYEFQCNSGQCIDEISICDGNNDCTDGSDETITQCINFRCPKYGFQCAYGGCINKIKKCDGREDCIDGSDEDIELCKKNINQQISTTPKPSAKQPIVNYGRCQLPKKPDNGNYEVVGCIEVDSCHKVQETTVKSDVSIKYSCNRDYVLSEERNLILCKNGTWNPEPPRCLKLCEGVHSCSRNLKCSYRGSEVKCSQPMRPETQLKAECKDTYHTSDHFTTTTQCLSDGTLADKLSDCIPDCGIRNAIKKEQKGFKPLMRGGRKPKHSEYPWHAGFYLKEEEEFAYKCGGTIIHPKAILTAAHCVYDDTAKSTRDTKKILVAVGKHWSNWKLKDDNEQRFGVINITIPKGYSGDAGRYAQDIAILHLERLIELNPAVMPICLGKGNYFSLDQRLNLIGTVVASGATKAGGPVSEELSVATFPVLGFHRCNQKISSNNLYLTADKFCVELSNDTSLMEGDSGSGLTIPRFTGGSEQDFIYGIVSSKPIGREDVAVLTDVSEHMIWIEEVLKAIEESLKKSGCQYLN